MSVLSGREVSGAHHRLQNTGRRNLVRPARSIAYVVYVPGQNLKSVRRATTLADINRIQDDIQARLAELEQLIEPLRAEAEQLGRLAATFGSPSAPSAAPDGRPARTRAKSTGRAARGQSRSASKSTGKRAAASGGGNRAQQAVELIGGQPGITASQLASAMGIGPNYLYRVLPQLQREGRITKTGKGYHPAGAVEEPAHANGQGATA